MNTQEKIDSLKLQIEEQRSWGNHKLADVLAEDLQALLSEQKI